MRKLMTDVIVLVMILFGSNLKFSFAQ